MASLNGLTAQALGSTQAFNWTWFIELATSGILVLWFLFYLNRLFATVVSYGIRAYTWHKFRVYIDIKSLQISFLGGRIFFKGVRYHGENETVYIHNGHITWRYWLRVTKQVDLCTPKAHGKQGDKEDAEQQEPASETSSERSDSSLHVNKPESRIVASISGLEWFIYNRTPVYDAIVQEAGVQASSRASADGRSVTSAFSKVVGNKLRKHSKAARDSSDADNSMGEKLETKDTNSTSPTSDPLQTPSQDRDGLSVASDDGETETEVSSFYSIMLRFFPLGIDCSRGAVSIGNEHTKAIIVTTFDKARGHINATASGPADIFRQVFDFDIEHPVVQMKPNPDYHLPQMSAAERIITGHEAVLKRRPWWRPKLDLGKHKRNFTHSLRNLVPMFRRSVTSLHADQSHKEDEPPYTSFTDAQPDSHDWQGLDRYMDEDEGDDHYAWVHIEYARFSTIFDCPRVHLNFFWDTPGTVKPEHPSFHLSGLVADLNGIEPPAYGMHLDVYGGLVHYGPWSDRLRVEVQNIFIPFGYRTAEPKPALSEGETRLSTVMTITVDIKEEITLRVPSRESTKDWRWRGRATAVRDAAALRKQPQRRHFRFRRSAKRRLGPDVRPFGWISVAAGARSKVRYVMDMYPGIDGYRNTLQLSLRSTKAMSSVNHAVLWECKEQEVSADLSNPLGWNELHKWRFDIMNRNMDLFLLRDHTFLLLDLISDFTAGLKSDYMTFMPFQYTIGIKFLDLNLFLNANDNNIIDIPCDLDDNAFLVLGFSRLAGQVDIPMKYFNPAQSSVMFQGDGQDAKLMLKTPSWHTLRAFGGEETMATLKTLKLDGSYNYFATTSSKLTDSLVMSIMGGNPKFHLEGYLIRYFMNVKDNYFGDTIHFSTLEEHQARLERSQRGEEEKKPPPKKENDLDVILSVSAESAAALMPANLYRRDESLRIDVLLIEADMRFTNYYMDLQVNTSPVEVSVEKALTQDGRKRQDVSSCQLFIDSMSVYGHRLFGAPPTEPTYLCNWDFDVGEILGECTADFLRILIASIMSFVFTMDDDENALPKTELELVPDVTFLRMRAGGIRTWIVAADTAFLVELAATTVELNDWTNKHFSKYVKVNAPLLLIAAVDGTGAYRHRNTHDSTVSTYACFRTSIRLAVLNRKSEFGHNRALQQKHIRLHDQRTHRTDWLLHKQYQHNQDHRLSAWSRLPPAMPVPLMPEPMNLQPSTVRRSADGQRTKTPSSSRSSSFIVSDPFNARDLTPSQYRMDKLGSQATSTAATQSSNPVALTAATRDYGRRSTSHPISSPWTKPQFQLQQIRPDLQHMPQLSQFDVAGSDAPYGDSVEDDDFPVASDDTIHNGIFCNLIEGITGFCTPQIFQSMVSLLNEVSPRRPESLLDDLQMQVVSNILKLTDKHIGQIDDIAFQLPFAMMRLVNPHEQGNTTLGFDQYDLSLSSVRASVRIAPDAHTKSLQSQTLVHANVRNLNIQAAICVPEHHKSILGAELSLSGAGLWLSLREEVRARTQIENLDISTASKNINDLAGLMQRSQRLIAQIIDHAKGIDLADRSQHMLYHLTSIKDSPEPPFLSRPVNVLRTADEHVRLHDSWAIIARLRYILWTQSRGWHETDGCTTACPYEDNSQVRKHILSAFDQFKSWGNAEKDDDALIQAVFGTSRQTSKSSQALTNIEAEVLLGRAAITLDPGPNQSQVSIQSLDLNFAEKPLQATSTTYSLHRQHRSSRVVQAYFGTLACHLNWELVEFAKQIIHLSQSYEFAHAGSNVQQDTIPVDSPQHNPLELSVIVGADAASFEVQSVNLCLSTGLERLKASFIVAPKSTEESVVSLVLSASSGRLRLRGKTKSIFGCKVTTPTISLSLQDNTSKLDSRMVIHTTATCGKLRFHVKQDVLGLLQVVQALLVEEVVAVQALMKLLAAQAKSSSATGAERPKSPKKVEPHVALFLDDYLIQFDLMAYLSYRATGTQARTSLLPRDSSRFSIKLDLKGSHHSFEDPSAWMSSTKSSLNMPPVGAAVDVELLPARVIVDARAIVESMLLEASAVRACFDAAYQPRTINYVREVRRSLAMIQKDVRAVMASGETSVQTKVADSESREVQYIGRAILEGINVHCSAPALRPDQDYSVDLSIALGQTTMLISNYQPHSKSLSQKPHFGITLQQVAVNLERVRDRKEGFGQLRTSLRLSAITDLDDNDREIQTFWMVSQGINLDLYPETAVLVVDLATFLQARIKSLALAEDANILKPLRRLTLASSEARPLIPDTETSPEDEPPLGLLDSTFTLEINAVCLRWLLNSHIPDSPMHPVDNLVFTVSKIDLRTTREASARLTIKNMQLQLVPVSSMDPFKRTANSALLPEMIFNAAYARAKSTRKFAFKAAGKLVDVKLASNFILPASAVQKSLALASSELRTLQMAATKAETTSTQAQLPKLLGTKRLAQLLVFAEFGGAEVTISPAKEDVQEPSSAFSFLKGAKRSRAGRYGQAVQGSTGEGAALRAPGIAFQIEYSDDGEEDPTLSTEIRVAASSNVLAPSVVPLVLEISSSVTNLMEQDNSASPRKENSSQEGQRDQDNHEDKDKNTGSLPQATDPTAILGRVKLNAGLWVQKQEFSLTCQPIARVSATARFDEIFVVVNTVQAKDQERFFSITTTFSNLAASVQHVYSRESTASFAVDSIMVSLMNSKHFSDKSGISAILDISPMKGYLNAKQMQDFMLFREIWYPAELRSDPKPPTTTFSEGSGQGPAIQRFQEVTSTSVLPWHAIVSVQALRFQVDLGQSIGKSDFAVEKLWASSKKNPDGEQNLCIGFDKVGIESFGRVSGFTELQGFRVRTAIRWPMVGNVVQAPLVQGSVGFEHLRAKAVFDYQPFAVVDVSTFDFLIYNVRQGKNNDRLVGILDGGKVQAFCIATAAAQGLSIYQAFEKLIQEKQEAFDTSLHELDRYLRRKSALPSNTSKPPGREPMHIHGDHRSSHAPRLHVDVVITLRAIDAGVFMSSFLDELTLKLEAVDVQTRFAVSEAEHKTHSGLGMSLGQVRLALSTMSRPNAKALGEVSITEVIERATNARGGTILKVPRLVASMQTWQQAPSNTIEYVFSSTFHGKVDIGWNYSRISTIRSMWESHSRALAQKMNKPLPPSAIKITAEPKDILGGEGQEKITAVVNMPQSKYAYIPLEPPVIDTPQLRDLGEATPSLEWIGLQRERLPHVTHSVIIVSLLEVAKEIEDSYNRILGSG